MRQEKENFDETTILVDYFPRWWRQENFKARSFNDWHVHKGVKMPINYDNVKANCKQKKNLSFPVNFDDMQKVLFVYIFMCLVQV